MKPAQLDALSAELGRAYDFAETKPMTKAMWKQEKRARRKKPRRSDTARKRAG